MKRFLILLSILFCNTVCAETINLHWLNEDGSIYQNSTCVIDSDLILPSTPPTKYGYTFTGWKIASYVPVEYLESTGTQYIDTDVVAEADCQIEIKYRIYSFEPNENNAAIYCAYTSDETVNIRHLYYSAGTLLINTNRGYPYPSGVATHILNVDYTESMDNNKWIIDGTTYNNVTTRTQPTINTMTVFNCNRVKRGLNGRIYYFKMWNNGTLVRDFIPVLDGAGTPCMFDKVKGKFYYNQGTGQFIAGPVLQ